jgi:hypothetical protein
LRVSGEALGDRDARRRMVFKARCVVEAIEAGLLA